VSSGFAAKKRRALRGAFSSARDKFSHEARNFRIGEYFELSQKA